MRQATLTRLIGCLLLIAFVLGGVMSGYATYHPVVAVNKTKFEKAGNFVVTKSPNVLNDVFLNDAVAVEIPTNEVGCDDLVIRLTEATSDCITPVAHGPPNT